MTPPLRPSAAAIEAARTCLPIISQRAPTRDEIEAALHIAYAADAGLAALVAENARWQKAAEVEHALREVGEQERDALAAQVAALREALARLATYNRVMPSDIEAARAALAATAPKP